MPLDPVNARSPGRPIGRRRVVLREVARPVQALRIELLEGRLLSPPPHELSIGAFRLSQRIDSEFAFPFVSVNRGVTDAE